MVSSPNQGGVYGVAIVLGVLSIIVVVLRFRARESLARRTGPPTWRSDDWLILVTTLFLWGLAIILIYGASVGTIGTHSTINPQTGHEIVTPHENQISLFGTISQLLTVLALGFLKTSVVLFYRRIFISNFFRLVSVIVLAFIAVWTLTFFLATVLQCDGENLDLMWVSIRAFLTKCWRYKDIQLAHAASDVVTDLIVLSMPLREIWLLQMSASKKVIVSLIFLVGLLSTAAATARIVIIAEDLVETTGGSRDVRGVQTNAMVWSYIEVGVAIVTACLPTLGPIFNRRNIDSLVASVRSRESLGSQGSRNDRGASASETTLGKRGIEMLPYSGPKTSQGASAVDHSGSTFGLTEPLEKGIRRDDSVTVHSENGSS